MRLLPSAAVRFACAEPSTFSEEAICKPGVVCAAYLQGAQMSQAFAPAPGPALGPAQGPEGMEFEKLQAAAPSADDGELPLPFLHCPTFASQASACCSCSTCGLRTDPCESKSASKAMLLCLAPPSTY